MERGCPAWQPPLLYCLRYSIAAANIKFERRREQLFDAASRPGVLAGNCESLAPLALRIQELRLFDQLVGLAVSNARIALPNFYNIAIRIANVAARLAVLGLRLRDELGSSTSPKFITRLNICNADIHKAAD